MMETNETERLEEPVDLTDDQLEGAAGGAGTTFYLTSLKCLSCGYRDSFGKSTEVPDSWVSVQQQEVRYQWHMMTFPRTKYSCPQCHAKYSEKLEDVALING